MHKVDAPNMVFMIRTQPDYGTVFVIKTCSFPMALWKLQTFLTPQMLYSLMIDFLAVYLQQLGYFHVNVTAIRLEQSNNDQA